MIKISVLFIVVGLAGCFESDESGQSADSRSHDFEAGSDERSSLLSEGPETEASGASRDKRNQGAGDQSGQLALPPTVSSAQKQEPVIDVVKKPELPVLNQYVLHAIKAMPKGGGYAISRKSLLGLKRSVFSDQSDGAFRMVRESAKPSFCSGATYLVFLGVLDQLVKNGALEIEPETGVKYAKIGQADGVGLWGRWNANGPGTAALFAELGCGFNFSDYKEALPGDFMKIWWTDEIGSKERGHSVIYLGSIQEEGVEKIRFWSSNIPEGYSQKTIPKEKAKRVLFSRLSNHQALAEGGRIAPKSQFLADMLKKPFTWQEVVKECRVRQ